MTHGLKSSIRMFWGFWASGAYGLRNNMTLPAKLETLLAKASAAEDLQPYP